MSRGAELTINADYAFLIQPFISKEEVRYYLNGFHVQPHPKSGALIIATDGRTLAIFHDEEGECSVPGTIRLNKTTIAACRPKGETPRKFVVTGDTATVYEGWDEKEKTGTAIAGQEAVVIDGDFPDWRKVVPPMPNASAPATFNFELVKKFEKIRAPGSKWTSIRVISRSESDPALVFVGRKDFLGVIMPMCDDTPTMPSWLPRAA